MINWIGWIWRWKKGRCRSYLWRHFPSICKVKVQFLGTLQMNLVSWNKIYLFLKEHFFFHSNLDICPQAKNRPSIFGVPYSLRSSYVRICNFWLKFLNHQIGLGSRCNGLGTDFNLSVDRKWGFQFSYVVNRACPYCKVALSIKSQLLE